MSAKRKIAWDGVAVVGLASISVYTLISASLETNIGDADKSTDFPSTRNRILSRAAVEGLNRNGMYVLNNVLTREELIAAHAGAVSIYTEGRMELTTNDSSVRQDVVCWVREKDGHMNEEGQTGSQDENCSVLQPGLLHCVQLLRGLSKELEELNYRRSKNHFVPKQCQLSRLRGEDYRRRRVTAILYLNLPGWDVETDGGELKCYLDSEAGDDDGTSCRTVRTVSPTGGTLVIFDSTELLHEVCPAHKERYALTIWITGDD